MASPGQIPYRAASGDISRADLVETVDSDDTVTDGNAEGSTGYRTVGEIADIAVVNAPIICIWTGSIWTTLAGDTVPTTATLVRWYDSSDDPDATDPTYYNVHDKWFGVSP